VQAGVVVTAGQLTDVSMSALGEITEMDEFVVQELPQLGPARKPRCSSCASRARP
jgi:hypothetical protein